MPQFLYLLVPLSFFLPLSLSVYSGVRRLGHICAGGYPVPDIDTL